MYLEFLLHLHLLHGVFEKYPDMLSYQLKETFPYPPAVWSVLLHILKEGRFI